MYNSDCVRKVFEKRRDYAENLFIRVLIFNSLRSHMKRKSRHRFIQKIEQKDRLQVKHSQNKTKRNGTITLNENHMLKLQSTKKPMKTFQSVNKKE